MNKRDKNAVISFMEDKVRSGLARRAGNTLSITLSGNDAPMVELLQEMRSTNTKIYTEGREVWISILTADEVKFQSAQLDGMKAFTYELKKFMGQGVVKGIGFGLVGLVALILFSSSFVIIDPGTRGVVMSFGSVEKYVLDEGPHFIVPVYQKVKRIDVKINKAETPADAATKDIQSAHSIVALNYHLLPNSVNILYKTIGMDYKVRIIDPIIQEVIKATTARYTAIELIQKREVVSTEIKDHLATKLLPYFIVVDGLSTVNFQFTKNFTEAVEAKQTAEQKALTAQNDLVRIKIEAEQKIASARAEAESLRLQKQEITPDLIKLRQIEAQLAAIKKWDGELPKVTGNNIPMISIADLK